MRGGMTDVNLATIAGQPLKIVGPDPEPPHRPIYSPRQVARLRPPAGQPASRNQPAVMHLARWGSRG